MEQNLSSARPDELAALNELSVPCGLRLTAGQLRELTALHDEALRRTGRIEFGGGILPKLVAASSDSPYISQADYADTLAALQDDFYYFKGEAEERFSDDELVELMRNAFNGPAGGSLDYMESVTLTELCRDARGGEGQSWK